MTILYISTLSSKRFLDMLYHQFGLVPFAVQKFSRMIAEGMVANGAKVIALSSPPFTNNQKPRWVNERTETENGVQYNYVPFLNFAGVKHLMVVVYTFFYVLFWGMSKHKEKSIVCDVLNVSICMAALMASKLVGVKSVGVVTDMPGLMVSADKKKRSLRGRLFIWVNKSYLSSFSSYVFLTEQMNAPINKHKRPYIIMEGLVDLNVNDDTKVEKSSPRTLIYAGGLYARYGLKMLCDAFLKVPQQDVELLLYGKGTFVEELQNDYCKRDKRIKYMGVRPNEEVVAEEHRATLLINPRPTNEEFTQYSFPSKNMEYMATGTPLLTTRLPGMPAEYHPHVFLFDEETVGGYSRTITDILSLPAETLAERGVSGKRFVMEKKNNIAQSARILELITSLG